MTLMGIVQNYAGLLATRFFLGLTEAPFFPGAMYVFRSGWMGSIGTNYQPAGSF